MKVLTPLETPIIPARAICRYCMILIMLCVIGLDASGQTTYRLYVLAGQSNMEGFGYVADIPPSLRGTMEGVWIYHGNTAPDGAQVDGRGMWRELRPGHGVGFASDGAENRYSDRFGVELTFAAAMAEAYPGERIALLKYARGGTAIDTAAAANFGAWDPDFEGGNGVNQYDHFLAALVSALSVRDIDGDGQEDALVPAGILWMQGESDAAATADVALSYGRHLKRLMDLFRAALRTDDVPVAIGRISDSGNDTSDGKVWNYGAIVRGQQAAYVRDDRYAALVTSTDSYGYSDTWHYDSAGYLDLGRTFARAIVSVRDRATRP